MPEVTTSPIHLRLLKQALLPGYRLLDLAGGFALHQRLGEPTLNRYRQLINRQIGSTEGKHILDLGCGIGSFRPYFAGRYTGVDVNPAYIEKARAEQSGIFETMDGTRLSFADRSFDEVVTIATLHHIADEDIPKVIKEAVRVCRYPGHFHIIDAILPIKPNPLKSIIFKMDRGEYPRTLEHHLAVIGQAARIVTHEVLTGPVHDTVYVRIESAGGRGDT
jgi:ubiquinone/menaquinone biosynthesis C-methylase UbiE